MMFDVICVGSATLDHFLTIHPKLASVTYGAKVLVKDLETHTGGGGSNSAVALAKLGLKVAYLGKLGRDNRAKLLEREFQQYHIPLLNKHLSSLPTDQAFILNSEQEKDRIIYIHKGSSEDLTIQDLPSQFNTRWFYLATLVKKSYWVLPYLAKYAQKNHQKVLFNPSTYLAKQGLRRLKPLLLHTDLLILNQEEAQLLLKQKDNPLNLIKRLSRIVPTVIITNGPNKIYALHQNELYTLLPPKTKVIHTAGAGDAFNSALLAGIIKKYSFSQALQLAQANASSVIQHYGTKNKLLTETEAGRFIRRHKITVIKSPFPERRFYFLPFDHRGSFLRLISAQPPYKKEQLQTAGKLKELIYQAFLKAYSKTPNKEAMALLVDPLLGKNILLDAQKRGITTALTLEKSGQPEFQFDNKNYKQQLAALDPTYAKVLIRYNPQGDRQLNKRQAQKLADLTNYLRHQPQKFLLEVLVPPTQKQLQKIRTKLDYDHKLRPKLTLKAVKQLQSAGVKPDLWKLAGFYRTKFMQKIANQIRAHSPGSGIIVLGRGENQTRAEHWLKTAAKVKEVIGFAVGRTVFQEPIRLYHRKRLSKQKTIDKIAKNYLHFIKIFEEAKNE